jgi:hypothetical protein
MLTCCLHSWLPSPSAASTHLSAFSSAATHYYPTSPIATHISQSPRHMDPHEQVDFSDHAGSNQTYEAASAAKANLVAETQLTVSVPIGYPGYSCRSTFSRLMRRIFGVVIAVLS